MSRHTRQCSTLDEVEDLETGVIIFNTRDRTALGTVKGERRILLAFSSEVLAKEFIASALSNRDTRHELCEESREDLCAKARQVAFTEIVWDLAIVEVL